MSDESSSLTTDDLREAYYILHAINQDQFNNLIGGYGKILGRTLTEQEGLRLFVHLGKAYHVYLMTMLAANGQIYLGFDESGQELVMGFPNEPFERLFDAIDKPAIKERLEEALGMSEPDLDLDVWGDI